MFNQQKTQTPLVTFVVSSVLALTGCGESQQQQSLPSAAVTEEQLLSAIRSVNTIDYLPFSQTEDGCYARSLYMAMEIASRGVPVSSQFLIATSGSLQPALGYNWGYHIAPAVWVDGESEPFILDPSLFNRVSTRAEWVRKLNPTDTYDLKFSPASVTAVGSSRLKKGPSKRAEMIARLSEVGAFPSSDITYSCRIMSSYIALETHLSPAERSHKQVRLTTRTKQLIRSLRGLGIGPDGNYISDRPDDCY